MRAAAALLLLLLGAAPAFADARSRKYYYEDIFEPFFAPDLGRPGWLKAAREGARDSSFPLEKAPGTLRVFVIGGSIASLLDSEGGMGLGEVLRASLPAVRVEVLNCGMGGYDSYREALVEQEVLEYRPDLIVLMTGHNELLASAPVPIWIMKARERLERFAAFRALAASLQDVGGQGSETYAAKRDEAFERNLAQNIRQARRRGVEVLAFLPPRDYEAPPGQAESPYDPPYIRGWLRFLRADAAGARTAWEEAARAASSASARAFGLHLLARAQDRLGEAQASRRSFEAAAESDRSSICGPACRSVIRRVAEREGAATADGDALFRALSAPRLPNAQAFADRMHWKPRFNCRVALAMVSALRERPRFRGLPWDARALERLDASCPRPGGPDAERDDLVKLNYALMLLTPSGVAGVRPLAVYYLASLLERRREWFRRPQRLLDKRLDPGAVFGLEADAESVVAARVLQHAGEAELAAGRAKAAARHLRRAVALAEPAGAMRLGLAAAEALSGRKAAAAAALEAAVRLASENERRRLSAAAAAAGEELGLGSPESVLRFDPEAWLAKAESARAAGDGAAAKAALDRACELPLSREQKRLALQQYRLLREHARVLELADAVLAAYPDEPDLLLIKAEALVETGRGEEARAVLDKAAALSPDPKRRDHVEYLRRRAGR